MFPRPKRVSRGDFPTLLSSRRRVFSTHFSATLAESPRGYAVVVAKKVEATSVGRHTLKRRILGVLEAMEASLPAKGVIIFAKAGAAKLDAKSLKTEITDLFKQSK
jgi:ribonuclease P protein component